MSEIVGNKIYQLAQKLWPIHRSITGEGFRQSLKIIQEIVPNLVIKEVKSGTAAFDWNIPDEWNVREAWIKDPNGNKIVDIKNNNLHLVSYSIPFQGKISLQELQKKLYSLPEEPTAIPYITSYYFKRWGFCLTQIQRDSLIEGEYEIFIDTTLAPGVLNYGEIYIKGNTDKEIFLSTYLCHPSMANNELSGPTVTTFLAKWLNELKNKEYSYRIIFIPETIGSITYLSKNIDVMKKNVVAGFNLTCVGDDRTYSYLPSRNEKTLADQVALHILKYHYPDYKIYSFLDRGSDERQYCAPGIDLPIVSVMRTKYAEYKEYHTSLDDLNLISPIGLEGSYQIHLKMIQALEMNIIPRLNVLGEPQLGKRGLYPNLSTKETTIQVKVMMDFLAYCDGSLSMLEIAEKINVNVLELKNIFEKMQENMLLDFVQA